MAMRISLGVSKSTAIFIPKVDRERQLSRLHQSFHLSSRVHTMATWIDYPLGLGNDDGEFSTMYGTPIKPVLSPTTTITNNYITEKHKDKGFIVSAIRLLKVRQVRFLMLGGGLGLVLYLAVQNTPIPSTSLRTITKDFQGGEGGGGTGGFLKGIDLGWTMFAFSLVVFKCTVFITQIAMHQAVSQRRQRQPSKEAATSDKKPLLKSDIYLE